MNNNVLIFPVVPDIIGIKAVEKVSMSSVKIQKEKSENDN